VYGSHFEVIGTAKYRYGETFLPLKLNSISAREICHQRINNYLQTVLVRGKIAGPTIFVYIRVAYLGDFSLKKANFGILLKTLRAFFFTNIWTYTF
jgi:hypothetical protein